jgi:diguanylate cyclase (GGDEF)-like protein
VDSLRHDLEQSKKRIQHLEKLADQDTLTPVANRRAFVRELSRMLSFAQGYGSRVSVLYFDIDDIKHINDTYGYPFGDAAYALQADDDAHTMLE